MQRFQINWQVGILAAVKSTKKIEHVLNKEQGIYHLAKSYILKSSPKRTCYSTNTLTDVYLFSLIFTQFTYFPQDVSKTVNFEF